MARFRHPIAALEGALNLYEDFFSILGRIQVLEAELQGSVKMRPNTGAIANWHKVRSFLLDIHRREDRVAKEALEYIAPNYILETLRDSREHLILYTMPLFLTAWSMKSRRVYKLSKETQKVLEHTKLDGITWEDFKLPFECFGIELADPLSNPFGVSSDFILVSQTELTSLSRGPERKDIHIIGLTEDLRSFNRKSKFVDAAAVESVPSRKEMKKELVLLQQGMRRFIRPDAYRTVVPEGKLSKYLTELPENVEEELSISQDDRMLRIVLGLSLYLESLSPNSKAISASEVKIFLSGKDKSAIIDPAEVLRVNTVSPLTRDEKIFLGLEGTKEQRREIQMCCHWRAGHWRRPPGKGSDPSFPKTVHIPPTLVRRDRLPENALPGGAIKGI